MAALDFAILTGISYYAAGHLARLDGPPNDLDLFEGWLRDPRCGDVPAARIVRIESPRPHPVQSIKPVLATPALAQFEQVFDELAEQRIALGDARLTGRLYLYFSGHGFTDPTPGRGESAALLCANATQLRRHHIPGVEFARAACDWALFKEVVLIMDCCRGQSEGRTILPRPFENLRCPHLAQQVRWLDIFAVPSGAAAPECMIPERGRVHGLLTHVLVKLLTESQPAATTLSGAELRAALKAAWPTLVGNGFAVPRILAGDEDITFRTPASDKGLTIRWAPQPAGSELVIRDGHLTEIARFDLAGLRRLDGADPDRVSGMRMAPGQLHLQLPRGMYHYLVTGPGERDGTIKVVGGSQDVHL